MVVTTAPAEHPFEDPALDFPVATPVRQFYVICSTPRCGSSLLARELWGSGACGAPHEYFNFFSVLLRYSARLGTASLHDYVRRVVALRTGPNGVFGFKAHLEHFLFFNALTGLAPQFQPMKYIVIDREDPVAQAVSLVMARHTGQWIAGQPAREAPAYDRQVIAEALKELEEAGRSWRILLGQTGVEPLRVSYRALCAEPAATVAEVIEFLGVDRGETAPIGNLPPVARQEDPLKAEWIARYREEIAAEPGASAG